MGRKRVTVEVDERVWETTKSRAKIAGMFISRWVEHALSAYYGSQTGVGSAALVLTETGVRSEVSLDSLRASGLVKTARQLQQEREARRGDESGSQVPDGDDEAGF